MGNQSDAADIIGNIADDSGNEATTQPMSVTDSTGSVINLGDDGSNTVTK
jgi:hypothetical protein